MVGQREHSDRTATKFARTGVLAVCVLAVAGCIQSTVADEAVIEAMQAGGLVLYWRHGATDWNQSDEDFSDMSDCSVQRNLSGAGREQAAVVGEALDELDIRVDAVISSPFCRNIETAEIAFGRYEIEEQLFNAPAANEVDFDADRLVAHLKEMLAEAPDDPERNTVIVGHNFNLQFAAGLEIDEGYMAVFRPEHDTFRHLGTLSPEALRNAAESP